MAFIDSSGLKRIKQLMIISLLSKIAKINEYKVTIVQEAYFWEEWNLIIGTICAETSFCL